MSEIFQLIEFQKHDPELVSLNIKNVDLSWDTGYRGGEEIENDDIPFILEKLGGGITRLNSGRINNATLDRVKKMVGGWHIQPFYGLADRAITDYFRFKPQNPPADWKKPGKSKKYLGAEGVAPRAYSPNVSETVWAIIAARYGVKKTGDNFWEWVLDHPEIPIIITEGEKKALAGLFAGYALISLPGIDCGYKSISNNDDGSGGRLELIPDLKAIATGGRKVYVAFDRDSNPKTVKRVQQARRKLAHLFAEAGSETFSIKWPEHYKGLDDFIFGAGQEELNKAIESSQNITPQVNADTEDKKPKIPPALAISKLVFADLFAEKIRRDGSTKQFWRYDGRGKWVVCSDEFVFGIVQEYLEESIEAFSPAYVRNVIEFARKDFLHEGWTEASSLLYLPFINGVLELATNKLLPHSPDYGFTWQLPRTYSIVETGWPSIYKFLKTFCSNNDELAAIAIAYCNAVLKGRADLQKFLYLFGSGGNGKGVFMDLLAVLVGRENTHSTNMTELNESRFESANLKGKRLVVMTDEDRRVGGVGIFKAATGQDSIRFEKKGKDASNFKFQGMFVVAANSPTFVGESNPALKRRKIDFPALGQPAEGDRRDLTPEFEADLTAFTSYLLSLADEWVTETLKSAGRVQAVKNLAWEMAIREDSVTAFYDSHLVPDPVGSIACGVLYKEYQIYCDDSGLRAKNINNFTPSLIELCNTTLKLSIEKKRTAEGNVITGVKFHRGKIDISNTTGVTPLSSLPKKNLNFLFDIERYTQPTLLTLGKDLEPTQGIHLACTGIHPENEAYPEAEESF
jgi:putative DNA primase/helicase